MLRKFRADYKYVTGREPTPEDEAKARAAFERMLAGKLSPKELVSMFNEVKGALD